MAGSHILSRGPRIVPVVLLLFVMAGQAPRALAYPALQLYLEGGLYDPITESWFLAPPGSSAGEPFRLWVIGNTSWKGTIYDVRLSMAYSAAYRTYDENGNIIQDLVVSFSPSTTGGAFGFTDPSVPGMPEFIQAAPAGTVPLLGDGSALPPHGIFGPNTVWQEWLLGDFTLQDSPIGDFVGQIPLSPSTTMGQINVYELSIMFKDGATAHGVTVHFDAYNHVIGNNHVWYRFVPFSHDADADVTVVPEPGSVAGLGGLLLGAVTLGSRFWKRRRVRPAA